MLRSDGQWELPGPDHAAGRRASTATTTATVTFAAGGLAYTGAPATGTAGRHHRRRLRRHPHRPHVHRRPVPPGPRHDARRRHDRRQRVRALRLRRQRRLERLRRRQGAAGRREHLPLHPQRPVPPGRGARELPARTAGPRRPAVPRSAPPTATAPSPSASPSPAPPPTSCARSPRPRPSSASRARRSAATSSTSSATSRSRSAGPPATPSTTRRSTAASSSSATPPATSSPSPARSPASASPTPTATASPPRSPAARYSVTFVGGSFSDTAGVVNQAETEIFTLAVATAALADPTHAQVIDRGELEGRGWVDVTFGAFGGQDLDPLSITDADAEITLTSPGSTIVVDGRAVNLGDGKFRFFYTGYGRKNEPLTATAVAGTWKNVARRDRDRAPTSARPRSRT